MKQMKKFWLMLVCLALTYFALGNARPTVSGALETERVNVVIQGDLATLTGTFGFRRSFSLRWSRMDDAQVHFPVVCPKGSSLGLEDFNYTLKVNGRKATSYSIVTNAPVDVPASDSYSVVWILARCPGDAGTVWNIEVSYQQKLVNGVFYYLPILGQVRAHEEAFQIRVKADRPVHSVGKGGGFMAKGPQELLFIPANLVMIGVSVNPVPSTDKGGSKPLLHSPPGPGRLTEEYIGRQVIDDH